MVTREEFLDEVRELIGVLFVDNGFSADGVDCVGLVLYPAHKLGLVTDEQVSKLQDQYLRIAIDARLVRACEKHLVRASKNDLQTGDIILFLPIGFKFATHLAVYSGEHKIIHSAERYKKVVETHLSQQLEKEIVRVYRFKEFD